MLYQVLKKFKAEGRELMPGDIVETAHWKNERLLLLQRFIGVPSVPQKLAKEVKEGIRVSEVNLPDASVVNELKVPAVVARVPKAKG